MYSNEDVNMHDNHTEYSSRFNTKPVGLNETKNKQGNNFSEGTSDQTQNIFFCFDTG